MEPTKEFDEIWLLLLRMVEKPSHVADEQRKAVATVLCDLSAEDLSRQCVFTDVPAKLRTLFPTELAEVIKSCGCCPPTLYTFLLMYRARLPYQNQSVEGLASKHSSTCLLSRTSNVFGRVSTSFCPTFEQVLALAVWPI